LREALLLVQDQFNVFPDDRSRFEFELNLKKLRFGIVIVHVEKNIFEFYRRCDARGSALISCHERDTTTIKKTFVLFGLALFAQDKSSGKGPAGPTPMS
jgi:hypothetical protein